jgi:membrane protein
VLGGKYWLDITMTDTSIKPDWRQQRWIANSIMALRLLRRRIEEDRHSQQAAAMTYNTLFSLLPTLVLILVVMSMVLSSDQVATQETALMEMLGLSQLEMRQVHPHEAGMTTQPNSSAATAPANSSEDHNDAQLLTNTLTKTVDNMRSVLQQPGTGIVGFAVLLWGAISLMNVIETAGNRIYRVTEKRPWTRRLTLYWCVLTIGPLGVAASLYFSAKFVAATDSISTGRHVVGFFTILLSNAGDWLLIFILYKLIPNTHVRWISAAIGALLATVLWELGKFGFGLYVHYLSGYGKWYGNLGLIPLFMFWVYLTWNFLLLGLEVAFVHQYYSVLKRRFVLNRGFNAPLIDAKWILPLSILLVRRFEQGKKTTIDNAADELGVTLETTEQLLDALQQAGLVYAMGSIPRQFVLARAPEKITVEELLHAVANRCHTVAEAAMASPADNQFLHNPAMSELYNLEHNWHHTHTLASLAEKA